MLHFFNKINKPTYKLMFNGNKTAILLFGAFIFFIFAFPLQAIDFETREVPLFEYMEWSVANGSCSGNPFDLVATVKFTHEEKNIVRATEMFYDGDDTWKFRFAGLRTGKWHFKTISTDKELSGHTGTVIVTKNNNKQSHGFLGIRGQKFVRYSGDNGRVEGFIPNIWMNYRKEVVGPEGMKKCGWSPVTYLMGNNERWRNYLDQAWAHGCNGVQILPQRDLLDMESSEHNPHIENFRILEKAIIKAHEREMIVNVFLWGDAARGWTPPDGINSESDLRFNRYLAARLGPLPGWYISLGFDLLEWVGEEDTEAWASHLKQKLGWYHPIGARKEKNYIPNLEIYSTDYRISGNWYENTREQFETGGNKPIEYSRRFSYLRDGVWDMDATRQAFWAFAMAGGAGSIWGHYPDDNCSASNPGNYPNPEQLRTHRQFWENRFLSSLEPVNNISDGHVLKNYDNTHFVVYKENTSSININIAGKSSPLPVVAIDCKASYTEIDYGSLKPGNHKISLPHHSDWVIAIGKFDQ